MLTPDLKLPSKMRLKESRRVPMWNGPIECRLFRFDMVRAPRARVQALRSPEWPMGPELQRLAQVPVARPVVIDTNIVLDLLVFADEAVAPLKPQLASGALQWIAAPAMRVELERVLGYPQIAPASPYGLSAAQVLQAFDAQARTVDPAPRASAICKDPDDQQFIDLAVQHGAILLSKDRAVLNLRKRLLALGVQASTAL